MSRSFDELVSEATAAPVDGWDFSWLDGRATEERPSWGYQREIVERLATASAALDIETGGGEVLPGAGDFPAHNGRHRVRGRRTRRWPLSYCTRAASWWWQPATRRPCRSPTRRLTW